MAGKMDMKESRGTGLVVKSEDVRAYLDGKMSPAALKAFELRMFAEPVVAEMVDLERRLRDGLKGLAQKRDDN